jgi:hypothetical protein
VLLPLVRMRPFIVFDVAPLPLLMIDLFAWYFYRCAAPVGLAQIALFKKAFERVSLWFLSIGMA